MDEVLSHGREIIVKLFFLNNVKNATLTVDQLQMTLKSSSIEARKAIQSIQT